MEGADGILRQMHPEKSAAPSVPACLQNVRLIADRDQGTPVAIEGTVRLAGLVWRRPSRYRIFPTGPAKPDGIRFYYLAGDTTVLNMLLDKAASIEGRLYHAEGVTEPVVVIESFEYGRTP